MVKFLSNSMPLNRYGKIVSSITESRRRLKRRVNWPVMPHPATQCELRPVKPTIECTSVTGMRNTIINSRFAKSPTFDICDEQHKKVHNQNKNNRTEHQQESNAKLTRQPLTN